MPRFPDEILIHNNQFCDEVLKVWKVYNSGSGKLVSWDNLDKDGKLLPYELKITESGSQGSCLC